MSIFKTTFYFRNAVVPQQYLGERGYEYETNVNARFEKQGTQTGSTT